MLRTLMLLCSAVLMAFDRGCAAVTLRCDPDLYAHDMRPGASARRAGELPPRQLANIVHGFAAMRHHPGDALLVACAAQAAERFCEANPQGLSNTLWGFAKVSLLVHLMLLAAMPLPGWILSSRRNLNVCAMSQLQFSPGNALLRASEAAAVRRAEEFKPQHVVRS